MPKGIPNNGINKGWIKKGQKLSMETRCKMSKSRTGKGNSFYGKKHTEEARKKIREARKKQVGKLHPSYGKHRTEEFKRRVSETRKGKCSGEENPAWLGGKSFEPYGLEFNEKLKVQIRKRGNYRCQECFRHQDELYSKSGKKYKLHVHHIDYNKRNNNLNNLISLCRNCHSQTSFERDDWISYFKQKLCLNR